MDASDPFAPPGPPAPGWGPPPPPAPSAPSAPRPDAIVALGLVIVALVVVGLGAAAFKAGGEDAPGGTTVADAGCEEVRDVPLPIDARHSNGLVEYDSDPPYGGPHSPSPLPALGFFPRNRVGVDVAERAVHNLEHGYVVIWYDAGAGDASLRRVADAVRAAPGKVIAVPWRGQVREGRHYTLAAWGHLQTCAEPTLAAIEAFYAEHGGVNGEAPEKNAL